MNHTKTIATALLLVLAASIAGCDSFFDRPPEGELTAGSFYNNAADIQMATAPLYNQVWFDWNDKASFAIGDAAAGNMASTDPGYQQFVRLTVTRANDRLNEGWRSLYLTIAHANQTITNIRQNAAESIPEEAKTVGIAEARFMRGYAYSYLGQLWGEVPIITNTARLIDQPDVRRNRRSDVYQFAINDFEFAAENLPEQRSQVGRVNAWSAKGMLARMHMARAALRGSGGSMDAGEMEVARSYAEDVIKNSGMSLREDYGDLFLLAEEEQNNRQEALFALQWTYDGDTWGTQNTFQSYFANSPDLTGFDDGWGGGTGVQGWLIREYDTTASRQPAIFMMDGETYPELRTEFGGYTFEAGTGSGDAYAKTAIKKYVIGRPADNDGQVAFLRTGIDTYMLRLPEVYLIYARALLGGQGSTSDPEALEYFNHVRERAGASAMTSITARDIFLEKWRELAFEGQNWFQLVRWHDYAPEAAIRFIEGQNRNYNVTYDDQGQITVEEPAEYTPITATDGDFSLAYPEADVLQNEYLDPGAYDAEPYDFSQQDPASGSDDG